MKTNHTNYDVLPRKWRKIVKDNCAKKDSQSVAKEKDKQKKTRNLRMRWKIMMRTTRMLSMRWKIMMRRIRLH